MDVLQAALRRRSIRRFIRKPIPRDALAAMAEAARLAPTGLNRQPLRFAIVSDEALCARVFPLTHWSKLIPDGSVGPSDATQPAAYIVILVDQAIAKASDTDAGAAAMSILLAAEAQGIASCWLGSVDRKEILALLGLSAERFAIHTVVALGYAASESRAVPMKDGDTVYYLEAPDRLCVPKRAPEDVIAWMDENGGAAWNET